MTIWVPVIFLTELPVNNLFAMVHSDLKIIAIYTTYQYRPAWNESKQIYKINVKYRNHRQ